MTGQEPPAVAGGSLSVVLAERLRELARHPVSGLVLAWLILIGFFALVAPNFLTVGNFLNIFRASAVAGLAAIAITVPLIAGSLDVSFGAVVSIGSIMAAAVIGAGQGIVLALAVALLFGGFLGLGNGLLVVWLRLDTLLVTLGTLLIYGGAAYLVTNGAPTRAPGDEFAYYGRGFLIGVPLPVVIWALVAMAAAILLRFTAFGQWIYIVGDNRRAATLAGIDVRRVTILALVFSGTVAALAGSLISANDGVAFPGAGERLLLTAIAGVIIGGTSLTGGTGSVLGTVIGILFLGTIDNGLNLLRVPGIWNDVIAGLVLVIALVVDRVRERYR